MASLRELGTKHVDTSEHLVGILKYIRSKFQPICHISHSSSTAAHLAAGSATHLAAGSATHLAAGSATHLAAGSATHLAATACISNFNIADLQAFIKLQGYTSTMPAKGKGGCGK